MEKTKITEFKPRGRTFTGTVVSAKSQKTVTVEWERRRAIPKYERHEKRRTKIKAHNPESISAEEGDIVVIKECRPISKTKHFIIVEKKNKDVDYLVEQSLKEEQEKKAEKKAKKEDEIKKEKAEEKESKGEE